MRKMMDEMYEGICDLLVTAGLDAGVAADHLYVEHICSDGQARYYFSNDTDMRRLRGIYEEIRDKLEEHSLEDTRAQVVLERAALEILGCCEDPANCSVGEILYSDYGIGLRVCAPHSADVDIDAYDLNGLKNAVYALEGELEERGLRDAGKPMKLWQEFLSTNPADVPAVLLPLSY